MDHGTALTGAFSTNYRDDEHIRAATKWQNAESRRLHPHPRIAAYSDGTYVVLKLNGTSYDNRTNLNFIVYSARNALQSLKPRKFDPQSRSWKYKRQSRRPLLTEPPCISIKIFNVSPTHTSYRKIKCHAHVTNFPAVEALRLYTSLRSSSIVVSWRRPQPSD
jgi:hypothetical protein